VLKAGPIVSQLTLVLAEGRKREVRRMMSEVGHAVLRLRRLRFGPVELGNLERGAWRPLSGQELAGLRKVGRGRGALTGLGSGRVGLPGDAGHPADVARDRSNLGPDLPDRAPAPSATARWPVHANFESRSKVERLLEELLW
jgi:hypothetical protein